MEQQFMRWAKKLQAISQIGLNYAENHYQIEQYENIKQIAAEMMARNSDLTSENFIELFENESGYATPKVDVRGVVFKDRSILLVRELADGKWTVPGGWADVAESPSESVIREVQEESGYTVEPLKLAAVYDRSKHPHKPHFPFHVYKLFFICRITSGKPRSNAETEKPTFFDIDNIPQLSSSRITTDQIARLYEHFLNPDLPTDFD